jgi:predicted Zn-dependent protease
MPDSASLYRNRAEISIHARQLQEAEADLAYATNLDGNEDSPYLWYRLAQLAVARGEGVLADQMLDEIMKRDTSFDMAY